MYSFLRWLLFRLPPELSHELTLSALKFFYTASRVERIREKLPQHPVEVLGIKFPNPVGLAAGLDKDAEHIDSLFGLGFGFIEVGAVTPHAQPGNPKPRLKRLIEQKALLNRFGFNNCGVNEMILHLHERNINGIVGVNIGKNKETPLESAIDDYAYCYRKLYPFVDFVTVNISSPNTPGLRELQDKHHLLNLLKHLKQLQTQLDRHVPLLVKVSPDLSDDEIKMMADTFLQTHIEGLIACNTTLQHNEKWGGMSGKPLLEKSLAVVAKFHYYVDKKIPIIGVGGIFGPEEAKRYFEAGASLIQVYTGLIYKGPELVQEILKSLNNSVAP